MARPSPLLDLVFDLLNSVSHKIDAGEEAVVRLGKDMNPKTFHAYATKWWVRRNRGVAEVPRLVISMPQGEFAYLRTTTALHRSAVGSPFRPAPTTPTKPITIQPGPAMVQLPALDESAWLDLWAEFCLGNDLPLESVMIAADGVPLVHPTSVDGIALIRRARSK